jgi:cysteinyl-tRNA synthetase
MQRLMEGIKTLDKLPASENSSISLNDIEQKCYAAMNDDLNSPMVIAHLFDGLRIIHLVNDGKETLSAADLQQMKDVYRHFTADILGMNDEASANRQTDLLNGLVNYVLEMRQQAKANRDFAASDNIRNMMNRLGIEVKDKKDGFEWSIRTNNE